MSAIAFLIAVVIALVAAGLHALVTGTWDWRSFVGLWLFGIILLIGPQFIHA